jgi:ketosteroid isomerase-like protein
VIPVKAKILLLAMVCLLAMRGKAQDAADGGAVSKVLALEGAWNQAEESGSTKALDALFDSALVYIDYDGKLMTKAEFLASVKSNAHPQQIMTESMTAHLFGNTVVVSGVYRAKGVDGGKPYVRRGRFIDIWTQKDGGWLCVASESTPILH